MKPTLPPLKLIDSHCHLHDDEFFDAQKQSEGYEKSRAAGVAMICVGTDVKSSQKAVQFAENHPGVWAIVGIHPHDAKQGGFEEIRALLAKKSPKIVGVGEIGLDYYYDNSDRLVQQQALREQLKLAQEFNLPISFHVRDEKVAQGRVWNDFWKIFDEFSNLGGVLHSFTDSAENLQKGLERGLYIGLNGISTFTKDKAQQEMFNQVPLNRLLLETDAPFLTPKPFRGKMNISAYVVHVAEHLAHERKMSVEDIAAATTSNVQEVFGVVYE